jgi:hypothetical protein
VAHLDDFYAKLLCLLALMGVYRADTDLDQALGRAGFHDAGEGAGVGVAIAFKFVVEVGMGVEVNDGQVGDALAEGANDGQGDGMIAAEADGTEVLVEQFADPLFDGGEWFLKMEFQVANVAIGAGLAEVDAGFGRGVGGVRAQSDADDRRRAGGSAKP